MNCIEAAQSLTVARGGVMSESRMISASELIEVLGRVVNDADKVQLLEAWAVAREAQATLVTATQAQQFIENAISIAKQRRQSNRLMIRIMAGYMAKILARKNIRI